LAIPVSSGTELADVALSLRSRVGLNSEQRFRLVGVGLNNFEERISPVYLSNSTERSSCFELSRIKCKLYWINNNSGPLLGIMPRPRGGDWLEDEMISLHQQGVNVLVSLLKPDEVTELHLEEEPAFCATVGIQFLSSRSLTVRFPIDAKRFWNSRQS
jgi:hypothetical protein